MANQLIASLDSEFDPTAFQDTYREKVLDLIERKAAGQDDLVEAPAPVEASKVIDLMAALEASVAAAKAARGRHPTGHEDDGADGSYEAEGSGGSSKSPGAAAARSKARSAKAGATATKSPAKKAPAKKASGRTRKSA